jgi:hypothetical protein
MSDRACSEPNHTGRARYYSGTIYRAVLFMRHLITLFHSIVLGAMFTLSPARAGPQPTGPRITTTPAVKASPLSVLAKYLTTADQDQQWEFAAITLDVLLDVYTRELLTSAGEKASTSARRTKLARRQRATRGLIDQIELARLKLAEGGNFSLYVDPRQQILIIVEGQTVVVSGPRASAEDRISGPVIEQFCAFNDCSILHDIPPQAEEAEADLEGIWVLRQGNDPSFRIGGGIHCEFDTLEHGDRKAAVCKRLAGELLRLAAALRQAASQNRAIDWRRLLNSPPGTTPPYIVLNADGAYLEIELDLLRKAEKDAWQDMLSWLRDEIEGRPVQPVIIRAGRFLQK